MVNKSRQTIDIVIPTWNTLSYLKACINSVKKFTNIPYRFIVINNGSTDGTDSYLEKLDLDVEVINNRENLGYPQALYQGYRRTISEYVCLMNDDVIVSPSWLTKLVNVMEKNKEIGILGPTRTGAHFKHPYIKELSKKFLEKSKKKRQSPQEQLKFFMKGKSYERFIKDYLKMNKTGLVIFDRLPHIISTCCAIVRKKAVNKAGGIVDTNFSKYGADDTDLCWRLLKAGYKLAITDKVYIHHFEHVSTDTNNMDREKLLQTNSKILYKKWKKDIDQYLSSKVFSGYTKHQILEESWLLERIAQVIGNRFWEDVKNSKPN